MAATFLTNPFLGTALDPDLILHLAARLEAGYSNTDRITTLKDFSSAGNDMSAPASGDRPRFDTGVLNSQPGFWFGGNADHNFVNRNAFVPTGSEAELICVVKAASSQNGNGFAKFDGGAWVSHMSFGGTIYTSFGTQDRFNYTPGGSVLTDGFIHHVVVKAGSNNYKVYQNGNVEKASGTATIKWSTGVAGTPKHQIGASSDADLANTQTNWYHGHILELKVWKRVLTTAERNAEMAALNTLYGISYTSF